MNTRFPFKGYKLNLELIQTDHNVEPKKASYRTIHTMIPFMKTEKTQNNTVSWSWVYVKMQREMGDLRDKS